MGKLTHPLNANLCAQHTLVSLLGGKLQLSDGKQAPKPEHQVKELWSLFGLLRWNDDDNDERIS